MSAGCMQDELSFANIIDKLKLIITNDLYSECTMRCVNQLGPSANLELPQDISSGKLFDL